MNQQTEPSPLWSLHCALDEFIASRDDELPDDMVIIIGVEMLTYMRRLYHTSEFSLRGFPVIAENMCPVKRILFMSMDSYLRARRAPEFWR